MIRKTHISQSTHVNFDHVAFEKLFKENFTSICLYCQFKYGFDLDQAKEAVHIGFIKLWEKRESIYSDQSVKAYLYKIIVNTCYDLLRHEKIKNQHERYFLQNRSANETMEDINVCELKQLKSDIAKAVAELPEQMRKIFEMSRYEGLKYSEIADKLSISVKTVETQMGRALVKLREKLGSYLPFWVILLFTTVAAKLFFNVE